MKMENVKKILRGEADLVYVFYTLGVKANIVLAILWFGIVFFLYSFDIPVWLENLLGSFILIWTLGYLPLFLYILIRTKPSHSIDIVIKVIGFLPTIVGILIGILFLLVVMSGGM